MLVAGLIAHLISTPHLILGVGVDADQVSRPRNMISLLKGFFRVFVFIIVELKFVFLPSSRHDGVAQLVTHHYHGHGEPGRARRATFTADVQM